MATIDELVTLSDDVWRRLQIRLEGLTNAEYFWEPAPGCWSIRERASGEWRADVSVPGPVPEPFTTVAWRLWHLIDMYGENRAPLMLDVPPQGDPIGLDDPNGAPPGTAHEALALLAKAHNRWDAHLALVSEESLGQKIGPVGGEFADRQRSAFVLHMLDEFIHHGAEVALLRDLWRWQQPLVGSEMTERAMRGDIDLVEDLAGTDPGAVSELMGVAASYARWDLVAGLVNSGVAIPVGGKTPRHAAAGAGELGVVQLLVANGADPAAKDPVFEATPLDWARFLDEPDVAAWLGQAQGD